MSERSDNQSSFNKHNLSKFLHAVGSDLQREYSDIQEWVKVDPGTAGDQGEENWASILKGWLPGYYYVVTKGKILTHDGYLSPQMDVLVLRPSYPRALIDKKLYLAGGVAAAFECKLTLERKHIHKAMTTAAALRQHLPSRSGSPYHELQSPILYGILAHSYRWPSKSKDLLLSIQDHLHDQDQLCINHPRKMIDVISIANLASWSAVKLPYIVPLGAQTPVTVTSDGHKIGPVGTLYACYSGRMESLEPGFSPLGAGLATIMRKLAWEDPTSRELADYFRLVHIATTGTGPSRAWDLDVYSEQTIQQLQLGRFVRGRTWDEWSVSLD